MARLSIQKVHVGEKDTNCYVVASADTREAVVIDPGDDAPKILGQLEGLKVRAQWDPQIAKAITFLPEAQTLEDHSKLAQKTTASAITAAPTIQGQALDRLATERLGPSMSDQLLISFTWASAQSSRARSP